MEFIKKNFAILLAFILPIAFIVVVALSTYIPSLFLSTHYNFVYTTCADGTNYYSYNCNTYLQKRYATVNNKLIVNFLDPNLDLNNNHIPDNNENFNVRIFLHDTAKNESKEISYEEAQPLTLNNLLTSPDGVNVASQYDRGGGDFLLLGGGYSSYGYYLTKGNSKRKLNLINDNKEYYYQNNFQFLGWVLPGRN